MISSLIVQIWPSYYEIAANNRNAFHLLMKPKKMRIPAEVVSSSLSQSVSLPYSLSLFVSLRLLRHRNQNWKLEGRHAVLLVMVVCGSGVRLHGTGLGCPRWRLPGNWMLVVVVHGSGGKERRVTACAVVLVVRGGEHFLWR